MKFSVPERLTLLDILPNVGDYTTLKIIRELREALSFDEEEHARLQFQRNEDMIRWSGGADKDIDIGETALKIIREALEKRNSEKKLHLNSLALYERFIEGEE